MTSKMQPMTVEAQTRDERQKAANRVRRAGFIPAVLYGHGVENRILKVPQGVFERVFRQAGGSTLVDLRVDGGGPVKVIIQDVSRHPITGRYAHVDFYQVKMTEKLSTEVGLSFTGESKAVKEFGGVLVKNLSQVKIECLPADLVHEIPVDISKLVTFDQLIKIVDLTIPKGITILEKPDEVVCLVVPPRSEEELKALEEKPEEKVEAVETVEKPKPEEEPDAVAVGSNEDEPKSKGKKS